MGHSVPADSDLSEPGLEVGEALSLHVDSDGSAGRGVAGLGIDGDEQSVGVDVEVPDPFLMRLEAVEDPVRPKLPRSVQRSPVVGIDLVARW